VITKSFLTSKHVGGLGCVLPGEPGGFRTVFVPTAGGAYPAAPWIDARRRWLGRNGFDVEDLDLASSGPAEVARVLSRAELVFVEGGNTYFLLHHMRKSGFWEALAGRDVVYAGVSAGAVVACPDISYIGDLDDRSMAPELEDTRGAGVVGFSILPHGDDPRVRPKTDEILAGWPVRRPLFVLDDDEAIVIDGGSCRVVESLPGDLGRE
jgi:dipeptidase E